MQQSLIISNQRIQQLESQPNCDPCNTNSGKSDSSEIKEIWFLEQRLRQIELDVHENNTELILMKNNLAAQQPQKSCTKTRRRRRKRPVNNCDSDKYASDHLSTDLHFNPTDIDASNDTLEHQSSPTPAIPDTMGNFLDKPSPAKIRRMSRTGNQHHSVIQITKSSQNRAQTTKLNLIQTGLSNPPCNPISPSNPFRNS